VPLTTRPSVCSASARDVSPPESSGHQAAASRRAVGSQLDASQTTTRWASGPYWTSGGSPFGDADALTASPSARAQSGGSSRPCSVRAPIAATEAAPSSSQRGSPVSRPSAAKPGSDQ
jgi:hypothetical protein